MYITIGQEFTQIAKDCQQHQTKAVQEREIETNLRTIINLGPATTGNQTVNENRTSYRTKHTQEVFSYIRNNTSFCISGKRCYDV